MFEYGIENVATNEELVIYGYSVSDAFKRANIELGKWIIIYSEYVD